MASNSTLLTYYISPERAGYLKRRVKPCVMRRPVFKALKGRDHISPFQGYSLIYSSSRQGFTLSWYITPFQGSASEVNKVELNICLNIGGLKLFLTPCLDRKKWLGEVFRLVD
jgi:hypothetical protein